MIKHRDFELIETDQILSEWKISERIIDMLRDAESGLTYSEISIKHEIPIGTVRSRLSRARTKIENKRMQETIIPEPA